MKYKTLFIVDPVKSDRIQLAKFIKQENFTIMGFVNLPDCFKQKNLRPELVIYVLRRGKTEVKAFKKLNDKFKAVNYILVSYPEMPEVNLAELENMGYKSVFKANNNEKVREITYGLLAPDGLMPRTETPHPIPFP